MTAIQIDLLYAAAMFALVFASDFAWTWWARMCEQKRAYSAATASVAIYLIGGVTVLGYVGRPWLLVPAMLGAFCGTLLAMRWFR